jgi:hypothetical protein
MTSFQLKAARFLRRGIRSKREDFMKKLTALCLAVGMLPSVVLAAGNHPMAGCGLAYMLFAKDDNSRTVQILAGTTNGSFGAQTFGITSGTSGCTESGRLAKSREAEVYAEVNLKNLQREMAAGGGEYLNAFAALLGVSESNRPALFKLCQEKYADLFPAAGTTSVDMLGRLQGEISARPELLS